MIIILGSFISNMKDPEIPSFGATCHGTYIIDLNVYFSVIAFKLMTSLLLDHDAFFIFLMQCD